MVVPEWSQMMSLMTALSAGNLRPELSSSGVYVLKHTLKSCHSVFLASEDIVCVQIEAL